VRHRLFEHREVVVKGKGRVGVHHRLELPRLDQLGDVVQVLGAVRQNEAVLLIAQRAPKFAVRHRRRHSEHSARRDFVAVFFVADDGREAPVLFEHALFAALIPARPAHAVVNRVELGVLQRHRPLFLPIINHPIGAEPAAQRLLRRRTENLRAPEHFRHLNRHHSRRRRPAENQHSLAFRHFQRLQRLKRRLRHQRDRRGFEQ